MINQKLYEMIRDTGDKMHTLSAELSRTTEVVKSHNGFREMIGQLTLTLDGVCKKIDGVESEGVGKNKVVSALVIVIGVVGTILGIVGTTLAIVSRIAPALPK